MDQTVLVKSAGREILAEMLEDPSYPTALRCEVLEWKQF